MSSTLPGKQTQVYTNIRNACGELVNGVVLVVDPSIGSTSSMPGWAAYIGGVLQDSGTLQIDLPQATETPRWTRLRQVYQQLSRMSAAWKPDVCIYEEVPVSAHSGRSQVSHASLLNAVGVTMAAIEAPSFVGIPPITWKKFVTADYVKSDEQDAVEMGRIVIAMAREILIKDPPRKYRSADVSEE